MRNVVYAGLINWIVTTIIVEGVVFNRLRRWLDRRVPAPYNELWHCHLCAGTWVGLFMAVALDGPIRGPVGVRTLLNGFLYKAVGHIILELTAILKNRNRLAERDLKYQ